MHMGAWIQDHRVLLGWLGVTSILTFLGTLVIVPWLVVRIPSDYFIHQKRQHQQRHPVVKIMIVIAKNSMGYVFLITGVCMLVLPGQGLLTMFVGVMLLDFPGKYQVERRAVSCRPVLRSVNWLRQRAGRDPLLVKGRSSHSSGSRTDEQ
jgi:hypothetical protein